jgi:hypothetical protein
MTGKYSRAEILDRYRHGLITKEEIEEMVRDANKKEGSQNAL